MTNTTHAAPLSPLTTRRFPLATLLLSSPRADRADGAERAVAHLAAGRTSAARGAAIVATQVAYHPSVWTK
jgi:hypothetical protein